MCVALIGCLKRRKKKQDYRLLNKVDFRINFISGFVLCPIFFKVILQPMAIILLVAIFNSAFSMVFCVLSFIIEQHYSLYKSNPTRIKPRIKNTKKTASQLPGSNPAKKNKEGSGVDCVILYNFSLLSFSPLFRMFLRCCLPFSHSYK